MPTRFDPHPRLNNKLIDKRIRYVEVFLVVAILLMGYIKIIQLTG